MWIIPGMVIPAAFVCWLGGGGVMGTLGVPIGAQFQGGVWLGGGCIHSELTSGLLLELLLESRELETDMLLG